MTLNDIINLLEDLTNKEGQLLTSVDSKNTQEAMKFLVYFKNQLTKVEYPTSDFMTGYLASQQDINYMLGLSNGLTEKSEEVHD